MVNLNYYKSNKGLFIESVGGYQGLSVYSINGKKCEKTHSNKWYFLADESEIKSLEYGKSAPAKVSGFRLNDTSIASEQIPEYFKVGDVVQVWDDEEETYVWENHNGLRKLYSAEYAEPEFIMENIEFEANCLGETKIEFGDLVEDMSVSYTGSSGFSTAVITKNLSSIVSYDSLIEILTPEFALHKMPCRLSSSQTYSIVRQYVKDNINTKQAHVTSDYNFCFTVKKKIHIKPVTTHREQLKSNGRSYAKPRFTTHTKTFKDLEVFEMTSAKDKYKGYTVIEGFSGDSLQDLADNIKRYLTELMDYINMEFKECDCCNGNGVIVEEFNKNGRS